MPKDIRIITTGGTFDKLYDEISGELTFRQSQLPRILRQTRCTLRIELEGPLAIDSLYMNEEQRQSVAQRCIASPEHRIIVIHGTDTMTKTAQVVAKRLAPENRSTIVFTGAMVPYSLENSDSVFNLGCAFSAVQLLPPGVYICMSGKIFTWDNVRKNKELGIFEELRPVSGVSG
ncbi:MAG: asparaginase domain-containing protein [Sphaerochaetaceae bacterium]|jgi:L-asparaginase